MRWIFACAALLIASPAAAQFGGGPSGALPVESSAPADPFDGQQWVRSSDLQRFVYSDSLGKWLGELVTIQANKNIGNATGVMNLGETGMTIAVAPYHGVFAWADSIRLMGARGKSFDVSTTASCTTFVAVDGDTTNLKLIWDANEELWTPGGSGWVPADSIRVAFGQGETVSLHIGSGGSVLPDNPLMWLLLREEVTP